MNSHTRQPPKITLLMRFRAWLAGRREKGRLEALRKASILIQPPTALLYKMVRMGTELLHEKQRQLIAVTKERDATRAALAQMEDERDALLAARKEEK